jgi:hypothetical protein
MVFATRHAALHRSVQNTKWAEQLKHVRQVAVNRRTQHNTQNLNGDVAKSLYYMGGPPFIHCLLINDNNGGKKKVVSTHSLSCRPARLLHYLDKERAFVRIAQMKLIMGAYTADVIYLLKKKILPNMYVTKKYRLLNSSQRRVTLTDHVLFLYRLNTFNENSNWMLNGDWCCNWKHYFPFADSPIASFSCL